MRWILIAAVLIPGIAQADWICEGYGSAGFFKEDNTRNNWKGTLFSDNPSTFVIRSVSDEIKNDTILRGYSVDYEVLRIGSESNIALIECVNEKFCNTHFGSIDFKLNRENNKFVALNYSGYLFDETNEGTPYIEIGVCTEISRN